MATYIALPSLSTKQVLTASYLDQLNDNLRVISTHDHSGSLGEGATIITSSSAASPFVNRHEITAYFSPSNTAFATFTVTCAVFFGGYMATDGACPASIMYPIGLFSGEYKLELMHEKNTNLGIASLLVGTSIIGQVDEYAATGSQN